MDDLRFGRAVRAVRLRRGWRQRDLASATGVSQQLISLIERGHIGSVAVDTLRRVAGGLEMRLPLAPRWRGGELDRLLDADHAWLQARTQRWLESVGWLVAVEVTYSRYGERGSIDLLAFRPALGLLLVVEIKTVIADLQSLLRGIDTKTRLARSIAAEKNWPATSVQACFVLIDTSTNRRRVALADPLLSGFSVRGASARAWLREHSPILGRGNGLLLFRKLPLTNRAGGRRAGRQRMRLSKAKRSVKDDLPSARDAPNRA